MHFQIILRNVMSVVFSSVTFAPLFSQKLKLRSLSDPEFKILCKSERLHTCTLQSVMKSGLTSPTRKRSRYFRSRRQMTARLDRSKVSARFFGRASFVKTRPTMQACPKIPEIQRMTFKECVLGKEHLVLRSLLSPAVRPSIMEIKLEVPLTIVTRPYGPTQTNHSPMMD